MLMLLRQFSRTSSLTKESQNKMKFERETIYANDEITFYVDSTGRKWKLSDIYGHHVEPDFVPSDTDDFYEEVDIMELPEDDAKMIVRIERRIDKFP